MLFFLFSISWSLELYGSFEWMTFVTTHLQGLLDCPVWRAACYSCQWNLLCILYLLPLANHHLKSVLAFLSVCFDGEIFFPVPLSALLQVRHRPVTCHFPVFFLCLLLEMSFCFPYQLKLINHKLKSIMKSLTALVFATILKCPKTKGECRFSVLFSKPHSSSCIYTHTWLYLKAWQDLWGYIRGILS